MNSDPETPPLSPATPSQAYLERLEARAALADWGGRREEMLSNLRLLAFTALLVAGAYVWGAGGAALILPAPFAAAFGLLVWLHDMVHQRRRRAERGVAYYRDRRARLEGRRPEAPDPGLDLLPEGHPYALHIDVLGPGSLFERLACRGSAAAREALAGWLLAPAPPHEIRSRQEAVLELRPKLDLREEIASRDAVIAKAMESPGIAAWAEAPPMLDARREGWTTLVLVCVTLGCLALSWQAFLASAAVQAIYARILRRRVREVLKRADGPVRNLALAWGILERLAREPLHSGRLKALRERLIEAAALRPLTRGWDRLEWANNQLLALLVPFLLWRTRGAIAVERWRARWGGSVRGWLSATGEFEALLALSAYAMERPDDCVAEIADEGPLLDVRGIRHPLLAGEAVANDLMLGADLRVLVVTGSNMSGKSTLLRAVGVGVVLAQAGAPVAARSFRLSPLRVAASVQTVDSLRAGASRFYAELQAIRRAVQLAEAGEPVLFLLDELLHGTNSRDREVGATEVVRSLVERGAIGLLTTHDLALAKIPGLLGPRARNVHFESRLEGGELRFDYRLKEGVVEGSNALELMRALGLIR